MRSCEQNNTNTTPPPFFTLLIPNLISSLPLLGRYTTYSMELFIIYLYMVLGLLSLLGCILWWWNEIWNIRPLKERFSKLNTKLPPGSLGFPFFGETLSLLWFFNVVGRPNDFITSKMLRYGENIGLYKTHLYGSPTIIACSPSLCKFVLNSSTKFMQDWPTNEVLGSHNVVAMNGQRHNIVKNYIACFFSRPDALTTIVQRIQPCIVNALEYWSQLPKIKTFFHAKKVTLDYTMRYIARVEAGAQINEIENLFEGIIYGFRAQPWNIPGTSYHHALKCRKEIKKKLRKELEARKNGMKKNSEEGDIASDLMEGLMKMKDEEGKYIKDEEVIDTAVHNILVGHMSIAYALTWSLYFLAKSPHVLQKLREENDAMVKENDNKDITYKDILKLTYTNKVAEETIRMANLSGFVFRKVTDDVEYKGYLIPKGWSIMVWLRHLHNDPNNFEDPMCFNPDRWENLPKHGTYLPFGGGMRSCPGSSLVRVSIALFLHHLAIGYKWELKNPEMKIKYLSHPLPSDGLEISIKKR